MDKSLDNTPSYLKDPGSIPPRGEICVRCLSQPITRRETVNCMYSQNNSQVIVEDTQTNTWFHFIPVISLVRDGLEGRWVT